MLKDIEKTTIIYGGDEIDEDEQSDISDDSNLE